MTNQMTALEYTSVYQMTYLFLETVEGKLSNPTLNDSFQVFLVDLEQAINKNQHILEAVKDSVIQYFENILSDKEQVEHILARIKHTTTSWNLHSPILDNYFSTILFELIEELLNE